MASEGIRVRGASLPKARQWLVWLAHHYPELPDNHGWPALSRDIVIGLHHTIVCTARRLRGNPTWDIAGTMTDDTERLEDMAMRNVRLAGQLLLHPHLPDSFRPLALLLDGACKQQVRLAKEVDLLRAGGAIQVDVSFDPSTRSVAEVG